MRRSGSVTACVLIIGNEILSGRIQDANLAFLGEGPERGRRAAARGAGRSPTITATIVATVNEVRRKFDYVFTTGGIGPTHDDITAQCIADAFGVPLILHPDASGCSKAITRRATINEARLRMAHVPEGAVLLLEPDLARAGVPDRQRVRDGRACRRSCRRPSHELKHRLHGGAKVLSRSVSCGLGEGTIAKDLGGAAAALRRSRDRLLSLFPAQRFRRHAGGARHRSRARIAAAIEELKGLIRGLGGDPQEGLAEE